MSCIDCDDGPCYMNCGPAISTSKKSECDMTKETPIEEALRLANKDKESILKRIETEIRSAEALPNTGEINNLLRAGRLGSLHLLKETFVGAGWIEPRKPHVP